MPLTPAEKKAFLHDLMFKRYMTREAAEAFIARGTRDASRMAELRKRAITEDQRVKTLMRPIIAHAKAAGESCRGEGYMLPTDNFWYAWLIAALARGVAWNETGDRFTQQLADMTLREIAEMADTDPSFYDT